jgi:signal transduction histidine kinase
MSESQSKTAAEAQEAASSPEPASPRDRVSELEDEVSALKTQVKELIRTEAQLHRTQNDLDHQLKVFGKLHELGVEIGAVFDIDKIAESIVNFTLYELGYERAIVLLENPETGSFRLAAKDGYFGKKWKGVLDDFELPPDHPLVASVREGGEQTFPPQKGSDQAPDAGTLAAAEVLDLGEFLTYPLVLADRGLSGVIMAGNSESQKEHYVRTSNANSRAGLANLSAQAAAVLSSALSHEELAQERNLLDQKVKERTADLAKALEELEELDNAKSQFFANVSHELRTPLTLSIAPLEEILSESASVDEATKGRHLGVIYKNQLRLLKLINNLLDFAKVDAGRMGAKFRPHDVAGAIRFYAETMSSAAEARSIKLVLDLCADRMRLYVDPEKFEKVVMNLLSNAFKFTPDDGEIRITMTEDDTHLRIAVADTGIGIPRKPCPSSFSASCRSTLPTSVSTRGPALASRW